MAVSHRLLSTNVTAIKTCQSSSELTRNTVFDGSDFWPASHLESDEKLLNNVWHPEVPCLGPPPSILMALYGLIPPFLLPSIIPVTVAFAALPFNLQNHVIWTAERRRERVPKLVSFLVPFWSKFWPPKCPPKWSQKLYKISNFGVHF